MDIIVKLLIALRIIDEPTADNALKSINKALAKLEAAIKHQQDKAEKATAAALAATKAAQDAVAQAERAKRNAAKIGDLLA